MSFYKSSFGKVTGKIEDCAVPAFTLIPNGTIDTACIISAKIVIPTAEAFDPTKYIELTYQLVGGDYKDMRVSQKIRCFGEDSPKRLRALNMLIRLLAICNAVPFDQEEPSNEVLAALQGQLLMIEVSEWSLPRRDGNGVMEGNWVSGIYKPGEVETKKGVKKEPVISAATPIRNQYDNDSTPPPHLQDIPW